MNRNVKDKLLTILGTALMALAINGFYSKIHITLGGASGLSLLIYNVFGIKTSYTIMIINVLLLITGYLIVGKEFVENTLIGSLSFPLLLNVVEIMYIPELPIYLDLLLGSTLMGLGTGLVILARGSSGGSDALGIILNKRFGISYIKIMICFDLIVMLLSLIYLNVYTIIMSIISMIIQMCVVKLVTSNKLIIFNNRLNKEYTGI